MTRTCVRETEVHSQFWFRYFWEQQLAKAKDS